MPLIAAENVRKTYRLGRVDVPVLHGASLAVERGEWVAVLGSSGSGKSTLLHLLGGLDRPDKGEGRVVFDGTPLASRSTRELDRFRRRRVGFVFQFYHLLPELPVLQNVTISAMVSLGAAYGPRRAAVRARAREILDSLGLSHRLNHRPIELSGGERQRVAIARALVNDPDLLLADEPTGNLDRQTGAKILDALAAIRQARGQTMVMVTHDPVIAERADRVVELVDGRVRAAS